VVCKKLRKRKKECGEKKADLSFLKQYGIIILVTFIVVAGRAQKTDRYLFQLPH